jgi:hypothetical protein
MAWWEGEDIDPDSGVSHITKAIASLVVFRDAMQHNLVTDDRPPRTENFYLELNQRSAELIDRYGDRNPVHYTQQLLDAQVQLKKAGLSDDNQALTFGKLE